MSRLRELEVEEQQRKGYDVDWFGHTRDDGAQVVGQVTAASDEVDAPIRIRVQQPWADDDNSILIHWRRCAHLQSDSG